MYLSDRDLAWAIKSGKLIVDPPPEDIDATSIDLQLDEVGQAKMWDVEAYQKKLSSAGIKFPELRIGEYNLAEFSKDYLVPPKEFNKSDPTQKVFRRANQIVVKPLGFLLWQTKEVVGTPPDNADLICFVDGKSTKARAGIVVHLTAPTIHTSWKGKITLEICNFGPFDLVLEEGDVIAQIIVAKVTSPPERGVNAVSHTYDQGNVAGVK